MSHTNVPPIFSEPHTCLWNSKLPRNKELHNKCILSSYQLYFSKVVHYLLVLLYTFLIVPRLSRKRGTLKLIRLSVRLSLCMSVTKTLTWLISFDLLKIEHCYLACMILVTRFFNWHHAMTFDLLQGLSCCREGDHNSLNSLVNNECKVWSCTFLMYMLEHCYSLTSI